MIQFIINRIPKAYQFNPFQKDYILNPHSKELTKEQQQVCLATSILVGIVTFGFFHLWIKVKPLLSPAEFKTVELKGKVVHIRPKSKWKSVPACGNTPNFSYIKPQVDLSGLEDRPKLFKEKVTKQCLEKMKASMKALDPSIVDACLEVMQNPSTPQYLNMVNTFSTRILDLYKAYVAVQIEDKTPSLPLEVGKMKACGRLTHEDFFELSKHCSWYRSEGNTLAKDLAAIGLTRGETKAIIEWVASHDYAWNYSSHHTAITREELDIIDIFIKHPDERNKIESVIKSYCNRLTNSKSLSKIKMLEQYLNYIPAMTQSQKEICKQNLADLANQPRKCITDHKLRLLQELQHCLEWRSFETGAVGSPLTLLNILEGKHDQELPDQHFRAKLFFCYASKGIVNEIANSKYLIDRINKKLAQENKGWQINEKLANQMKKPWNQEPVYHIGVYAEENNIGYKTRHTLPVDQVKEMRKKDPNLTYSEAERISKRIDVKSQDLLKRFRLKLYPAEEMAIFGTNSNLEERERKRRYRLYKKPFREKRIQSKHADTGFFESYLSYQKKTQQISWTPGKHYYKMHDKSQCKSPYLDSIEDLGLPQYSGISGSTDHTLTMAGMMGLNTKEDLMLLRFCYLPWMSGYEDHTVDEILIAAKSFGLDYTPSADYYKQIMPEENAFIKALEKAQMARGFRLPDYYLSKEYAKKAAARNP